LIFLPGAQDRAYNFFLLSLQTLHAHVPCDVVMFSRLARRIALVAGLLGITLLIGTIGFVLIEHYSWFEGFYMTLNTVTTIGYQELRPLSHAGRVFNSFLILFGVTALFVCFGAMTQTVIELELQDRYGQRRKKRMIDQLHDHFIVCGFGRVGRNASYEMQQARAPFLVMDRSELRVAKATSAGMLAVVADATRDDSLREAGVLRARGLIAALPSDAENLFIILSAKALNPKLTVVTRVSEEEAGEKLRRAGADTVFTPYAMAGRQLADALLRPHVVEFLDFARTSIATRVITEQVRIKPGATLAGKNIEQLAELRNTGVILLAVRRLGGETVFNPPPECELKAGDFLIVMGERPSLQRLEQLLTA
jgi:voltage-gated potassium channel